MLHRHRDHERSGRDNLVSFIRLFNYYRTEKEDTGEEEWTDSPYISSKIPVAGPGQRVVCDVEEVEVNGDRVNLIRYRVVNMEPDDKKT